MTNHRARPVADRPRSPVATAIEERPSQERLSVAEEDDLVFVGIDGPSNAAASAARWAADDARRRGAALCVVHSDMFVPTGYGGGVTWPPLSAEANRAWQTVLGGLVASVTAEFPGLEVRSVVGAGAPVGALHRAAQRGLLTVVGSRGSHQFTNAVFGSIAAGVVAQDRGPVVVVREDPETGTVRGPGPIVVGLDGSADSDCALAFALEEANLRDRVVYAVHCRNDADVDGPANADEDNRSPKNTEEHRALDDQLVGWADRYPDVVITRTMLEGPPTATLLDFCTFDGYVQPELLVVGSRGRGGFAGLVLGSTSQAVIAHAPCPVAVVGSLHGRHTAATC